MKDLALAIRSAEIALVDYMALKSGEEVLFTADENTDPGLLEILGAMVRKAGARLNVLTAKALPIQGNLADNFISPIQVSAMQQCDVWIDLAMPYFAGTGPYEEALKAGRMRYLLMGDLGLEAFCRLFGMVDFDDYFAAQDAFEEVFAAAEGKAGRITTPHGTDLSFEIGPRSPVRKPRRAVEPGSFLVPGACTIPAKIETARGKVVVIAGLHEFFEVFESPVSLTVDRTITSMTGGGASFLPLERALRRANGSGGGLGSIIHYTHGIHPAARFTGKSFIEDMRSTGHNAIGLGVPWWLPGGGESHPDAVLGEQSLWLGDEMIIDCGMIIGPPALKERIDRLVPLGLPPIK